MQGWGELCEPPNTSSPPHHHPLPTSLCKFKISCFQPKMNHMAPGRGASRAEGAVCVSWGTGSYPKSSISSKISLNFIPVLGKGWILVWGPYEFYSSKNQL